MVSVCYHWGAGMKQQQLREPSFQTMSDTSTECYIICFTEAERGDHQGAGSAPCFSVLPSFGHASATCGLLWPLPAGKSSQKTVCQWGELWNSLGAALFSLLWYGCSARGGHSQHWANHHSGDGGPASPLSSPLQMVLKLTYTYQVPVCPSGENKQKKSLNPSIFFQSNSLPFLLQTETLCSTTLIPVIYPIKPQTLCPFYLEP